MDSSEDVRYSSSSHNTQAEQDVWDVLLTGCLTEGEPSRAVSGTISIWLELGLICSR